MIWKRLAMVVPLLAVVSLGVFSLEELLPGDAAVSLAGEGASVSRINDVRQSLHLNDSFFQRYFHWVGNALHGDLGTSLYTRRSVAEEISSRWSVTLTLVIGAVLLALLISVPTAIFAGRREGGWFDRVVSFGSALGVAIPDFVIGIVLVIIFGIWLKWLPITGFVPFSQSPGQWFQHLILPVIALSAALSAVLTRQLRSNLASVLREDYMRTAYAKGLRERTVLLKHGLRAAAPPAVSILGVQIARLLGGVVVVESVFALPGLGQLTVNSIVNRDLPVVQGVIPLMVIVAVLVNLLADLLNIALSPRVRAAIA
jgi:peptide/nickel transport system permease protein